MESLVLKITERYWLKYKSILFLVIVAALTCATSFPRTEGESYLQVNILVAISLITIVLYSACCFMANRIPRAPKGKTAVLFVVDAESEQLYKDVRKKLISEFSEFVNNESNIQFEALYVKKEQIKNFSLRNQKETVALLEKTGAIFIAEVVYRVDSVTNAENYTMKINYGVLHPNFSAKAQKLLQQDINAVQKGLEKRKFAKQQLLDEFESTAQTLSIVCQYVIGLVFLLSGNAQFSYQLFHKALSDLERMEFANKTALQRLLQNRLIASCYAVANKDISLFEQTKNVSLLTDMNEKVEEANAIRAGNPDYYLAKAYHAIVVNRDPIEANTYIIQSRAIDGRKTWRYSEAFLAAYTGKSTMTIYQKYIKAFKVDYNLISIIDFIEYILEKEPEKTGLLFALGMTYEQIGDSALAKKNYEKYLEVISDEKAKAFLSDRIRQFQLTG